MGHTTQETITSAIHESVARAAKDLQEWRYCSYCGAKEENGDYCICAKDE